MAFTNSRADQFLSRCDAEPGALADYILALLKHEVTESDMRKELEQQLEEFLEKETKTFIDTLFTVLRTKSYLPYNAPTPPPPESQSADNGIPIPLDSLMSDPAGPSSERSRKRSASSDERDGRPKKGPRLGNDSDFSRYGNGRQDAAAWNGAQQFTGFPGGGMEGFGMPMGAMGMGIPMNAMGPMAGRRSQGYQPPGQKRGICRDYHNHGFCARGEMCKFSHGDDAVVPSQIYPMAGMMPLLYNMFNSNAPYDPHEPQGPNTRHPRAPLLPRDSSHGLHPLNAGGELPVIQDLTPSLPPDSNAAATQPQHDSVGVPMGSNGFDNTSYPGMPGFGGAPPYPGTAMDTSQDNGPVRPPRDGFRGRRGGRGGSFGGDANSARPQRRGDKTLVVEKIPEDKLTLDRVNAWFKKFGNVTNVAVDNHGAKALVSFSTHEEAHAAWKSEDAVFGNRFVKVFWHRPMEGHGQIGQRALAASASLVANMHSKDGPGAASSSGASAPQIAASTSSSGSKKSSGTASALAAKQELLEKQISEQKTLMASLSTATAEEKKDIMARLRKLNEEMKAGSSSAPTPPSVSKSTTESEEVESKKSDKEEGSHANGDTEETTEQLKAKLEKLKAEAASLGISESGSEPPYSGSYRGGYRGRARGRGFYRGGPALRGGPPRGSLKLDNRPKKLLVKGVEGDEGLQAVKSWYEAGGQVESVETLEDGDVLVSFKSRPAAEQGLAKGTALPSVGKVTVTWYTSKPSVPGTNTSSSAPTTLPAPKSAETDESRQPAQHHHQEEEEMLASGWGDDDADGMGMI
ncbi:hypothetical protein MD484_g46, partial [Candolleomyces efflorescens]